MIIQVQIAATDRNPVLYGYDIANLTGGDNSNKCCLSNTRS